MSDELNEITPLSQDLFPDADSAHPADDCLWSPSWARQTIAALREQVEQLTREHDEMLSLMPCGHSKRFVTASDEGTQYCALCECNAIAQLGIDAMAREVEMRKERDELKHTLQEGERLGWSAAYRGALTRAERAESERDAYKAQ